MIRAMVSITTNRLPPKINSIAIVILNEKISINFHLALYHFIINKNIVNERIFINNLDIIKRDNKFFSINSFINSV